MSAPRTVPAEFPANWPAVLRAEQAAGYLGFHDTAELRRGVVKGVAPRPHDRRGRAPLWYRSLCDDWLAKRGGPANHKATIDVADLI